jgi:aminopeptidase N
MTIASQVSRFRATLFLGLLFALLASTGTARAQNDSPLDVTNYVVNAEIIPATQTLSARVQVTFRPTRTVQSVIFELNGALEIQQVYGPNYEPLQFSQDRLKDLNVRVALSQAVPAGQDVTLTFDYAGQLLSAEGGVLSNKRLAFVGNEGAYLLYAGRWFPFHGYAADTATYTINLVAPQGLTAVGFGTYSQQPLTGPAIPALPRQTKPKEDPNTPPTTPKPKPRPRRPRPAAFTSSQQSVVSSQPAVFRKSEFSSLIPHPSSLLSSGQPAVYLKDKNSSLIPHPSSLILHPSSFQAPKALPTGAGARIRHTFVTTIPVLPGTVAVGKYQNRTTKRGNFEVSVNFRPGNEANAERFAEVMAEAGDLYSREFGPYAFGDRLTVAEIDDESLESYTTAGVTLLAAKVFTARSTPRELLCRETAYQWWGQAVGLKSFDDIWLSQGLATYSYLLEEEKTRNEAQTRDLMRDVSERALAFEGQTSILRAPAELDDQSSAYRSVIFYKGAFVFRMLRGVMGDEKFFRLLKAHFETNRGKQTSIKDFEALTAQINGSDLRSFFALWVDSTGVPEFKPDYQILRVKDGTFRIRGSLEQNLEGFRMPVDVALEYQGGVDRSTVQFDGKTADFVLSSKTEPRDLVIDPDSKILRISDEIRVAVVVRRGIQHAEDEEYPEAQQQFEAAIKVNRRSSWAWYNLGLLYLKQQNLEKAKDAFEEAIDGDLRPRWIEACATLRKGNCYDAEGKRDRAVAEYRKVVDLGETYDGVKEQAERYLEKPYKVGQ